MENNLKKNICLSIANLSICLYLNHFATYLKITQHCKSSILQ